AVSFVLLDRARTGAGSAKSGGMAGGATLHRDCGSPRPSLRAPPSPTDQPSRESAAAEARPMPDPAPVTIAILSSDAMSGSAFRWSVGTAMVHRRPTPWHERCRLLLGPGPFCLGSG